MSEIAFLAAYHGTIDGQSTMDTDVKYFLACRTASTTLRQSHARTVLLKIWFDLALSP